MIPRRGAGHTVEVSGALGAPHAGAVPAGSKGDRRWLIVTE
jgi:hypothetical protein